MFGGSVSIDEKVVVGTWGNWANYVQVFSRHDGEYERSITCDDCSDFGDHVATHGNRIVIDGEKNDRGRLFIYSSSDGELLKVFEERGDTIINDVAISEHVVVSIGSSKTYVYSNSDGFPKIAEIEMGGGSVSTSGDLLVIGDGYANNDDGVAYLYRTDGTLVKVLDRNANTIGSRFGYSVDITDEKIIVGASHDDNGGINIGSTFIYSTAGEFEEKILAPQDRQDNDRFGISVCASGKYYLVGANGVDGNGSSSGAAYLFRFSE